MRVVKHDSRAHVIRSAVRAALLEVVKRLPRRAPLLPVNAFENVRRKAGAIVLALHSRVHMLNKRIELCGSEREKLIFGKAKIKYRNSPKLEPVA